MFLHFAVLCLDTFSLSQYHRRHGLTYALEPNKVIRKAVDSDCALYFQYKKGDFAGCSVTVPGCGLRGSGVHVSTAGPRRQRTGVKQHMTIL